MHFLVLLSALVACAADVSFNTTNSALHGCIEDGKPTTIEHYPHQVALLYHQSLICGGSIISQNAVVTAARCVAGVNINYLKVRAGCTHHDCDGTIRSVRVSRIHELYNPLNGDYNVAVLQVQPPFSSSNPVSIIALENAEVPAGTNIVVTGWGSTRLGERISYNLLETVVEIKEDGKCRKSVSGEFTERMICAGSPCGCKCSHNEDIGGPLTTIYCPRSLVGIVSYGPRQCGCYVYPAVYTKVSAVRGWILQYLEGINEIN